MLVRLEQSEILSTAGGSINEYNNFGKQGSIFQYDWNVYTFSAELLLQA